MTLFDLFEHDPFDDDRTDGSAIDIALELEANLDLLDRSDDLDSDLKPTWPEVEVRTSTRRRKTSEARWVGGRIVVSLPAHLSPEAREQTIAWLVDRLVSKHQRRTAVGDDQLLARAVALSERYRIGARPRSVRWVTNQTTRWGSCSYHSGEIRLSHRLQVVPDWVIDSVLVHELAHLIHPNHSPQFHALADSYERHHEAGIFLAGYGLGMASPEIPEG